MGVLSDWWRRLRGDSEPESATDIAPKLDKLLHTHALLELRVERTGAQYQSIMLGYNLDEGYIILDEPFPAPGSAIAIGDTIEVLSHARHLRLSFKTHYMKRDRIEGDAVIKLGLPDAMQAPQNRRSFRVSTSMADNVRLDVYDIHGNHHASDVINLSFEGVRFSLSGNKTPNFTYGAMAKDCMLRLGDEASMRCTIQTRNMEYLRRPIAKTYIGVELSDISPRDRTILNQFIASLQRRQLRVESGSDIPEI